MELDLARHRSIFDPSAFDGRIDVIGVGATGSKIALSLAKLGLASQRVLGGHRLHVWDLDTVEAHNIPNQAFDMTHVGKMKTDAVAEMVERLGGTVKAHGGWAPEHHRNIGDVVFCMVDSMTVRRQIFETFKASSRVKLVIDSRMGTDQGQLLTYRPGDEKSLRQYEGTLFNDDDAHVELSPCGGTLSVGPTSDIISGLAVWAFMRYASGSEVENELVFGARTPAVNVIC